jgi:hypothetical protein
MDVNGILKHLHMLLYMVTLIVWCTHILKVVDGFLQHLRLQLEVEV